jgi:ABC-type Co2+ transport system permease subunit
MHEVGDPTTTAVVGKLAYAGLAAFGGVAKHLSEYLRGSTFRLRQLLANTVTSGFSGYIFAEIAYNLNDQWAYVAAGIGGYMGAQGLDYLFDIGRRWAEKRANVCPPEKK